MFFNPKLPDIKDVDFSDIESMSKDDFEKTEAYKKYILPYINYSKLVKRIDRRNWWKNNWIAVATLIFTVLTFAVTILLGIAQLSH